MKMRKFLEKFEKLENNIFKYIYLIIIINNMKENKLHSQQLRRYSKDIYGTDDKPRVSIFRSARHIYVQVINDRLAKTILSISSLSKEIQLYSTNKSKSDISYMVGQKLIQKALAMGIRHFVFDRNEYKFQGRIESFMKGANDKLKVKGYPLEITENNVTDKKFN